MASLFSKDKRIIYVRRIRNFWDEYSSKKIGMLGLVLLLAYVAVAFLAPWLTSYDPMSQPRLAQAFAMPEWVTILPQYQDLATTQRISLRWNVEKGSEYVQGWNLTEAKVHYKAETMKPVVVELSGKFSETQKAPNEFFQKIRYDATNIQDVEYQITVSMLTPEGDKYLFFRSSAFTDDSTRDVTLDGKDPLFIATLGFKFTDNIGNIVFSQKGEYICTVLINFRPLSNQATAQVNIKDAQVVLLGHVHGILGTEYLAHDIFTHLVHGARISLSVGLLAAIVGTTIGIIVGVSAGYLGGLVDEFAMRVVDILLCLPLLPLLLALVALYGRNVYYIVLFIAIFGWQGLARVIRSQTLSIRETAYIDTARASGASGFYIMLRHIVPNIIPVAFASMILAVPSAILFEASLSFLGFGDPRAPTWGMMLQHAFGFGGFSHLAWWWIIPPGLAIIGLCLSFVFMGYAFDEIVNPRLRRRR